MQPPVCPAVSKLILEVTRSSATSLPGQGRASSYSLAVRAAGLVRLLVEEDEDWQTAEQLIRKVRAACHHLEQQLPNLHVIHNVIKRILKLIREEYLSALKSEESECGPESLQKMLKGQEAGDYRRQVSDLRERVGEILDEQLMELETASEEISKQALEHIHANEIVMTLGRSKTVERFLKFASKTRRFSVIVAEAAPCYSGHAMAASLAAAKIPATVITDSAIFAMMARVNKVILGTSSILSDGGLMATAGASTVALAARHYSVPFIVLGAGYKLTPRFLPEGQSLTASVLSSPAPVMQGLEATTRGKVQCLNPTFSYVSPSLVTLLISNISGYSPSYVYRQMGDLYHQEDRDIVL